MAVQVSYPGVYIDEFTPGAPIQGVGTGVAAFLGPASRGEIARFARPDRFERITSWDRFQELFGDAPVEGYFLWYAVRGFFQNGGQACYVARVSNGSYTTWDVTDRSAAANVLFHVRLRTPGPTAATLTVDQVNRLPGGTTVFRTPGALPTVSTVSGREVTLSANGAATFRPGDLVTIGTRPERPRIVRITGDTLRIDEDLTPPLAGGESVRLASLAAGDRTLRIDAGVALPADVLQPGAMLTITQGAATSTGVIASVQAEHLSTGDITYRVTLRRGLEAPIDLAPAAGAIAVTLEEFSLAVTVGGATHTYTNLAPDGGHRAYFLPRINGDLDAPIWIDLVEPPPAVSPPDSLPQPTGGPAAPTTTGNAENLAGLTANDYLDALTPLEGIDAVNMVAAPDATRLAAADTTTVQQALITSCERLADRFAVLDARSGLAMSGANSVETQRAGVDSTRGYAALYYPWLRILPAGPGPSILAPPSGHVCGIMARIDATRGVHKAPANATVDGALGVERTMSDIEQGFLNLEGINVVRVFREGGRPELWGARTTATDRNWQYVNVRRLFLYLEESIAEGIRWAVFEPNNLGLWQKLRRTITEFLDRAWRDGALFGATRDEAFYVRIDEALNPFSEQALGRLHIEIGVRPAYPAEFIVVHIGIWSGGSEITEG